MARNGTGTYNLPAGNPVVTGSTISSTWANNTLNDLATALTGSISSDGQTTPTGNLPMGGYAHTGVADATVRTMYGTAGQIQDSAFTFLTSPSGTNTMTATASLGMSAYVTGQRFFFVAPSTNTGACTLNINAIGAKALTRNGTTALVAGDIVSGAVAQVVYDGTQFQLLNPSTVTSFSAGSTGLTPSTATTGAVTLAGTLGVANGGTGSSTLTANNVILGNGTSAVQVVAPGTSGNVLTSNGTTWVSSVASTLTRATSQNTTSGTVITFGSIPSTVKRITIMFNGVSISGTSNLLVQAGSGSQTTSGYEGVSVLTGSSSTVSAYAGNGFLFYDNGAQASSNYYGSIVLTNISSNTWVATGQLSLTTRNIISWTSGSVSLSGTLSSVYILTANGTDTFDAGSINILYE